MFPYQWVLFDADETLFHFDAKTGLERLFSRYDIVFSEQDYDDYQKVNKSLWLQYQHNEITATQLQITRFQEWENRLSIPAERLNAGFLEVMVEVCEPILGVMSMLAKLSIQAKIGIVTNGFTALQKKRLKNTNIGQYIDLLVISEQVGVAKPELKFFEFALEKMDITSLKQVLMVGDNLHTDILGGINAGFDTCWFNPSNSTNETQIEPTFTINGFDQFCQKFGLH